MSALVGYAALQTLGRRAGSTAQERHARLPGDQLVAHPQLITDHAITIGAAPEQVWPWLTQLQIPAGVDGVDGVSRQDAYRVLLTEECR